MRATRIESRRARRAAGEFGSASCRTFAFGRTRAESTITESAWFRVARGVACGSRTGSVVWQAIDNTTIADLHARLVAAFPDEPSERLAGDVEAFVAELVDRGLAQVEAG